MKWPRWNPPTEAISVYTPWMGYIVLAVAKKMISMNVDADVLARFDAWCKAQGRSRTSVVERFMDRQSVMPVSVVSVPPGKAKAGGIEVPVVPAPREVAPNFKGGRS